jgi:hypothetical protein
MDNCSIWLKPKSRTNTKGATGSIIADRIRCRHIDLRGQHDTVGKGVLMLMVYYAGQGDSIY